MEVVGIHDALLCFACISTSDEKYKANSNTSHSRHSKPFKMQFRVIYGSGNTDCVAGALSETTPGVSQLIAPRRHAQMDQIALELTTYEAMRLLV